MGIIIYEDCIDLKHTFVAAHLHICLPPTLYVVHTLTEF